MENEKTGGEFAIYNEGRAPLEVTRHDGTRETWTIKKVGLQTIDQWARRQPTQEERAVAYLEGRTVGEFRGLAVESQLEIVRKGGELNRPLFLAFSREAELDAAAWGVDQKAILERALTTALMARMEPELQRILEAGEPSSAPSNATETPATG